MLNSLVGIIASSGGAAAGGSYESIASVTLSSDNSSIAFTSIPSTYSHLQIRGIGKAATTANGPSFYFNGVSSGTSYSWHSLYGQADGVVGAQGYASQAYISGGNIVSSDQFTAFIYDIHNYASTTQYKTARWFSGMDNNGTNNAQSSVWLGSGLWQNTAAINQINLFNGYTWKAGSTFALYGIKGA